MAHLRCPTCRLTLRTRALLTAPHYCPRCLVRRRTPIALEPLPEPPGTDPVETGPAPAAGAS